MLQVWDGSRKNPAPPSAPSQQKHSLWEMSAMVPEDALAPAATMMMEAARSFVSRKQAGGTDDYCVVVACACTGAEQTPSLASRADSTDALEMRAPPEEVMLTTSPQKPVASTKLMHVIIVFEGDGRLKNSVKRSMRPLIARALSETGLWTRREMDTLESTLLSTLCPRSPEWALGLIHQPACRLACEWYHGRAESLEGHLVRHVSSSRARQGPAGAATMAQLGIDVLGPKRRKLYPGQPSESKRLRLTHTTDAHASSTVGSSAVGSSTVGTVGSDTAAASVQPQPAQTSVAALAELLGWPGELTGAIASERARDILGVVHAQAEELCLARLQLKFYKERDEHESKVSPNPYPLSLTRTPLV